MGPAEVSTRLGWVEKSVDLGSFRSGCLTSLGRGFDLELDLGKSTRQGTFPLHARPANFTFRFGKIRNKVGQRWNIGRFFYVLHVTGAFLCSFLIYFQYQFAIKRRHSHLWVLLKKEIRIWVEVWVNREHRPMGILYFGHSWQDLTKQSGASG